MIAAVASAGALLVFGAFVLAWEPPECWCAGRLVALDALTHTMVVAGMLALTGFAWRECHVVKHVRSQVPSIAVVAAVGVVALAMWTGGSQDIVCRTPTPPSPQAHAGHYSPRSPPSLRMRPHQTSRPEPIPRVLLCA